jgi:hypothetical protein
LKLISVDPRAKDMLTNVECILEPVGNDLQHGLLGMDLLSQAHQRSIAKGNVDAGRGAEGRDGGGVA